MKLEIDISDDSLDSIIVETLKEGLDCEQSHVLIGGDGKLQDEIISSFKILIEYYGG